MSSSTAFRPSPGAQQPTQSAAVQPRLTDVLESPEENPLKAQMLRVLHRVIAKSLGPSSSLKPAQPDWTAQGTAPSAVAEGSVASRRRSNTAEKSDESVRPLSKPGASRMRTPQACERCRERKTKCCGSRPMCTRCFKSGAQCIYVLDHKANRAQLRRQLKEAARGVLPSGPRPARSVDAAPQRRVSPGSLLQLMRANATASNGSCTPEPTLPLHSRIATPTRSDSSFDFLNMSRSKPCLGLSQLSSMSYVAPDASDLSQMLPDVPAQPSAFAADNSYSFMGLDSETNAAVAFMLANEGISENTGYTMFPPFVAPALSKDSSRSSEAYTPLPTPGDEDVLMMDVFGSGVMTGHDLLSSGFNGAELPCSDSELELELESCMAQLLPDVNGPTALGKNISRSVEPLPNRPGQVAAVGPPPIVALPGRSFPEVSSNGIFFDENMFDAFQLKMTAVPEVPKIVSVPQQFEQGMQADISVLDSRENGCSLSGTSEEISKAQVLPADKLPTIVESSEEMCMDGGFAVEPAVSKSLWDELFSNNALEAIY